MSTPISLQEILVSIADSLSQAQQELNNMPLYDSLGNPSTIYQLPYLDFNIVLSTKFELNDTVDEPIKNNGKSIPPFSLVRPKVSKLNKSKILFTLPNTKTNSGLNVTTLAKTTDTDQESVEENGESITTISGKFVAVLPNEGLPQTLLNVFYEKCKDKNSALDTFIIKVNLFNTAGERLAYRRVEFNFDLESSNKLSVDTPNIENIKTPIFSSQEEYTNEEGYAETTLKIQNKNNKFSYVVRINSGAISKSISI